MAGLDMQIVLMARETKPISAGTPGHIFFCIEVPLAAGLKEDCFGFYPDDSLKAFNGPGSIVNEFTKPAMGYVKASLNPSHFRRRTQGRLRSVSEIHRCRLQASRQQLHRFRLDGG